MRSPQFPDVLPDEDHPCPSAAAIRLRPVTAEVFKAHDDPAAPGGSNPLIIEATPMALETASYIHQLDAANPSGPDRLAQGDDHLRLIKAALKATFPNITAPVTATAAALNNLSGLLVPVGVISLWFGDTASVPAGYAICDGALHAKSDGSGNILTPDLRGRVVTGADGTHAAGTLWGQNSKTVTSELGGAHTHVGTTDSQGAHTHSLAIDGTALTIAQMPAHTHSETRTTDTGAGAPGGSGGTVTTQQTGSTGGGAPHTHTGTAASAGAHTHALAVTGAPDHAHAVTVDVTQAAVALHYIMKV